ncbi:MAG: InlB B-repeat-containing protein [Firmicutes bacterium]|nr:InlB B-repeat-containing protein [Bacillota bacterium]
MKKRLSLLVALVMAFTIFCIPGSSAAFAEGEENATEFTSQDNGQPEGEVNALEGEEYTVTFYDGYGTATKYGNIIGEPQTVLSGKAATAPENPTRDGYIFNGWDQAFSNVTSDLHIRALWRTPKKYTITFNANGGTNAPAPQTKIEGQEFSFANVGKPTRTNYTFTEWNTAKDGSRYSYSATKPYKANANVTLYAQWKLTSPIVGKIVANSTPYTTEKNSITVNWKILSTNKLYTVDKVVFYLNGKVKKTVETSARSGSYTFTGLSDGTYYSFAVKPYYKGKTLTAWKGKALTKAPVQNGAYKPGKYEYYYVNGVKQRNKTIQFKDTRFGTNKYSLNHYYDASGVFRGRTKYMYNKIKNMSSKKYLICIDRTNNVMCVYIGGKGKWRPYKYWSCVTGRLKKSDYHPTPLGTYTIKSRKLTFSGYGIPEKMKNRYSVWYCSRFVGSVFIHSQLYHYGQKSGFIPGGGTMGRNASHGCVRLNINYAHWVYKNCAKGTKVVVIK